MGVFDTPKELRDFITECEATRNARTEKGNARRQKMHGVHAQARAGGVDSFVPVYFNMKTALVPALCGGPPVAQLTCENPGYGGGVGQAIADALEQGLDANSVQTHTHGVYAKAISSALFDFGATYTGLEPVPATAQGQDGVQYLRPRTWYMPSFRVFTDPLASPEEGLGAGHVWIASKDALLAMKDESGLPKFDPQTIEAMAIDTEADDVRGMGPLGKWATRTAKRNDVVGYTVWCRETNTEYTLAYTNRRGSTDQQFLCEPRQGLYDDPDGPYTFWGLYWEEDGPYPFPLTAAIQTLVDSRDLTRRKLDDDARSAMRFVAADGKKNAMKVAQAKNKRILNWPGFQGKFAVVDLGGPQPASVEYEQILKGEIEETTAINANRLGNLDPNVPATAILDASQELEARKAYAKENVLRCAAAEMRRRARLMYHNSSVRFTFSTTDPETEEDATGVFEGGMFEQEHGLAFDEFRFEVSPQMGYQSEQAAIAKQRQVRDVIRDVLALTQSPGVNIENVARDAFSQMQIRNGDRRYLHTRVLERIQLAQATMLGAGSVPEMPQDSGPANNAKTAGASDVRSVAASIGAATKQGNMPKQGAMSVQTTGT